MRDHGNELPNQRGVQQVLGSGDRPQSSAVTTGARAARSLVARTGSCQRQRADEACGSPLASPSAASGKSARTTCPTSPGSFSMASRIPACRAPLGCRRQPPYLHPSVGRKGFGGGVVSGSGMAESVPCLLIVAGFCERVAGSRSAQRPRSGAVGVLRRPPGSGSCRARGQGVPGDGAVWVSGPGGGLSVRVTSGRDGRWARSWAASLTLVRGAWPAPVT